jgi:anaerobic selenocysteine-containing dehydrogenase
LQDRRTYCRICVAGCGLIVTVDGDAIVTVKGDRAHPDSQGYTCPKGRALGAHHVDPDRLDEPRLRGAVTSWEACLDDLAGHMKRLIGEHGNDTIGTYIATGHYCDKGGLLAERRLNRALGSSQCYSGATVDTAPAYYAAELVTGYAEDIFPVWDPEETSPGLALVIGQNPVVSHGYFSILTDPVRRIREYRQRGGSLWVVDPRRTETAALADRHLAPRPGTDALLLAWLVRELLADGADQRELVEHCHPDDVARLARAVEPFGRDLVAELTGVAPADLDDLITAVRRAGRIVCVVGTGITFGPNPAVAEWLRWALLIVTGSIDRPGGMRCSNSYFNPMEERAAWDPAPVGGRRRTGPASRPELGRFRGEYPVVALAQEIEAGRIRGLVVSGGNPLAAIPEPDKTVRALRSLELLAVVGVVENELTELATHVLPVAGQLERADTWLRDRAMYTEPVVPPVGSRRPGWWVFSQLARRLGHDVLGGLDPDECNDQEALQVLSGASPERFREVVAAGTHGVRRPRRDGWVRERALPGGRWRVAPVPLVERLPVVLADARRRVAMPLQLTSRRQVRAMNSAYYRQPDAVAIPDLLMHPADASRLGIDRDSPVTVRSSAGRLQAKVRIDGNQRVGVVSMTHGQPDANVGRLLSRDDDVEDFTGQPRMTAVAVDVAPVAGPA